MYVHPYDLLEYFQNKKNDSNKTLLKASIKWIYQKTSFLIEEAINFIAHTEKRKKVPVCEMLESSAFLSSSIMETEERQV